MKGWKGFAGIALAAASLATAADATAQVLVVGTGDPGIDIAAVQAAVDTNQIVFLKGIFSFASGGSSFQTITVSRNVLIAGVPDEQGGMATIVGGTRPFLIAAPSADVGIDGLRFRDPVGMAIQMQSGHNVSVSHCVIDGVVPVFTAGRNLAIGVFSTAGPFGMIDIADNDFDIRGSLPNDANGIILAAPSEAIEIACNRIVNTTAHGIDLRNVGGSARVERNELVTGPVGRGGGTGNFVDGIRCVGSGSYVVEHNSVDAGFENAAAIRVGGTTAASIRANDVVLSLAPDAVPGAQSAGIQVEGSAGDSDVLQNRIGGRGRVAFSVIHSDFPLDKGSGSGNPVDTRVVGNEEDLFVATFADVEVGAGAVNTRILGGSGTLSDLGTGTLIRGGYKLVW